MARHVGFGVEGSYGSAGTVTDFTEAISETLKLERSSFTINTIRKNAPVNIEQATSRIVGDVVIAGNYQDHGLLLKHFFGSVTTSGSGPYTHTFPSTSGTTDRSELSLTAEVQRDSTALTARYTGCKVVGWTLSGSTSQPPQSTFSLQGKTVSTGSATSYSDPGFDAMLVADASLTFDAAAMDVTAFSIAASWPVDDPYKIGSTTYAVEPIDGNLTVEGSCTVLVSDLVEYALYDGSSDVDIALALDDGTHSLTINMNKCRITDFPWNINARERMYANVTWQARYDTAATENIQAILVNDDATIPS